VITGRRPTIYHSERGCPPLPFIKLLCGVFMTTYMIEPGDWESATGECLPRGSNGVVVVPVGDLRKAIEPVLSWFDMDGEAGEPVDVVLFIGEIATALAEDRRDLLLYRKALRAIIASNDLALAKAIARDEIERHVESA